MGRYLYRRSSCDYSLEMRHFEFTGLIPMGSLVAHSGRMCCIHRMSEGVGVPQYLSQKYHCCLPATPQLLWQLASVVENWNKNQMKLFLIQKIKMRRCYFISIFYKVFSRGPREVLVHVVNFPPIMSPYLLYSTLYPSIFKRYTLLGARVL